MWKSIADDERTWMCFKANLHEAYLDREDLEQTAGAAGYGSVNNIKYDKMEDAFVNFVSATAARDAAFTKLTKTNGNLSTQLMHQEDQIRELQAELWNLKVAAAAQTTEGK